MFGRMNSTNRSIMDYFLVSSLKVSSFAKQIAPQRP